MLSPAARAAAREVISAETAAVPEAAYGVLSSGELHEAEGADRIFRVASITKSFTAAALAGLVRGLIPGRTLRMEDEILDWLPELAERGSSWAEGTTVGDLAHMASGLPTDDPWADRQETMFPEQLLWLLGYEPIRDFAPGTGYRYSNYGYAMLGAIIERASQTPYRQLIEDVFLTPLGMTSSGFDVRDLDQDRLVTGFRRDAEGQLEPQPVSLPGAFSSIGGLASTVRDLSTWVQLHIDALSDGPDDGFRAIAAAAGDDSPQRVRQWKRLFSDQQQPVRSMNLTLGTAETGPSGSEQYAVSGGYGMGLRCYFDTRYGSFAGHSGGYPGFGLHMRWHAASRTGLILFTALTGFPTEAVSAKALEAALEVERRENPDSAVWPDSEAATATPTSAPAARVFPVPSPMSFEPSERAQQLARDCEWMVATGDDCVADMSKAEDVNVFSENMDLDQIRTERHDSWAAARKHTGEPYPFPDGPEEIDPKFTGASTAEWTVTGPEGSRTMTMTLNPFEEIQSLRIRLH